VPAGGVVRIEIAEQPAAAVEINQPGQDLVGRGAARAIGAQLYFAVRAGAREIAHLGHFLRLGRRHLAPGVKGLARLLGRERLERGTARRADHGVQGFGVGIERHSFILGA